jgi:hypothetical protein
MGSSDPSSKDLQLQTYPKAGSNLNEEKDGEDHELVEGKIFDDAVGLFHDLQRFAFFHPFSLGSIGPFLKTLDAEFSQSEKIIPAGTAIDQAKRAIFFFCR